MKVRLRGNGYKDWKVLEESSAYYIVEGDFAPLALKKLEYEPVQEWVDVTRECHATLIDNTYRIYHRVDGTGTWIGDQYGYRVTDANDLSKIKVEKRV